MCEAGAKERSALLPLAPSCRAPAARGQRDRHFGAPARHRLVVLTALGQLLERPYLDAAVCHGAGSVRHDVDGLFQWP